MRTDPIADMLTRIRNAGKAGFPTVDIPGSRLKRSIGDIMAESGFVVKSEWIEKTPQSMLRVHLKYDEERKSVITGIRRVSRPGRRVYVSKGDIPVVLNGLGISLLSTSQGIVTDRKARELSIGGEVLCEIW